MKNKKVKELLTRMCTVAISFVTATTLTACSLSFQGHGTNENGHVAEDVAISSEEVISVEIDNTDFTDDSELDALAETITTTATELVESHEMLDGFVAASMVRVVDGDTIVVEIEGNDYKVRMIGIDTPESVASEEYLDCTGKENTAEGMDASNLTKSILADYDTVYLAKDVSDTDKYGRLLRYVWLELPEDEYDLGEVSAKMLNAILVEKGAAQVVTYAPDTAYEQYFESLADIDYD